MKKPAAILITALAAISLLCSCGSPDTAPTRRTPRETTVAASGKNEKAAHEGGDTAPISCETCAYGPGDKGEGKEDPRKLSGYRVLCNDNTTNEQIISEIENGTLSENKDIFLIGKDVYFYV